jgi:hypothetical protein
MKSNAQLRRDDLDDAPQPPPPPIHVAVLDMASVSILASFCVWTKSFMCKDAVKRDSTCQSIFIRLCTMKKIEDFRFPVSRPDDVSSFPDAHLSTVPSVWTTCSSRPDARQTSIIRPDDLSFPSGPYTVSKSFCSSLHPSGPLSSLSRCPSVIDQLRILSKFSIWEGQLQTSGRCGFPSGRDHK